MILIIGLRNHNIAMNQFAVDIPAINGVLEAGIAAGLVEALSENYQSYVGQPEELLK